MLIYFIYIQFFCILSFVNAKNISSKERIVLTILGGSGVFLIMALRDVSVGVDLVQYLRLYESANFHDVNFLSTHTEFGYSLYVAVLKEFGISSRLYIFITSFIISSSFSLFYYKYAKNIPLAFFLHMTIGLFILSLTAIRQILAVSIILYSYNYIIKRKFIPFLLIVLLASTFHMSALVFLPMYIISKPSINKYSKVLIVIVAMFMTLFIRNYFIDIMNLISPEKYILLYGVFNEENKINPLLIIIAIVIPIAIAVVWKVQNFKLETISKSDSIFFIGAALSAIFTILSLNSNMILRLSYYFIPTYIVLLPNTISNYKYYNNYILTLTILSVICIVYFYLGTKGSVFQVDNYTFFW